MHARAGLLLIATTSVFCAAAQAQTSGDAPAKAALFDAVFASPPSAGFGPAAWSAPGSAAPPMLMDQTLVASAAPAPTVFKMSVGGLDFDVSPHARVDGASGDGGAEAGATFSLGRRPQADALSRLGLRADSDAGPHGPGRWRLFVAASGHEIDWAMARSLPGGLQGLGWSNQGATMISDAQAGVEWRRGAASASFGYVHRDIHGGSAGQPGPGGLSDSMVAVSFSLHAH